jgi:hypothetical protein
MSPKLFFAFLLLCQTVNINFACKNGLLSTITYTLIDSNKIMRKIYNSTVISSRFNGGSIGAGNQNLTKLCCEHLHITHKVNLVQFSNFQIEEIEPECFSKQMYKVFNSLVFINNKFPIVRKGMFKNLQCRLIVLVNNKIESIENEAFDNLPNVETIELVTKSWPVTAPGSQGVFSGQRAWVRIFKKWAPGSYCLELVVACPAAGTSAQILLVEGK